MATLPRFLKIAAFCALALPAVPAYAASNGCTSDGVLNYIDRDFDIRARRYLKRDIGIVEIFGAHRNRYKARDETHPVEREYCHATARFTDGRKRTIWYLIERNWGFAGVGPSTEYCVSGLDPIRYYGRNCLSLR